MSDVAHEVGLGRDRAVLTAMLAIPGVIAAAVGAYVDWLWWPVYEGVVLTIIAAALLVVGVLVSLVGRGIVRRGGLVVLAVGIGLVAGQNLGPAREPLVNTQGGTMTVRLESPVVAEASGPTDCLNVASATEFSVHANQALHLAEGDRVVDGVYITSGDRWVSRGRTTRSDGIRLEIGVTDRKIPDSDAPVVTVLGATEASDLESTFSNDGGSIRFAGLSTQVRDDFTAGQPIDLAGTIEWTCGDIVVE